MLAVIPEESDVITPIAVDRTPVATPLVVFKLAFVEHIVVIGSADTIHRLVFGVNQAGYVVVEILGWLAELELA